MNRRDTIKTIHAVGDAIGAEAVPRAEAREVIAGMSDLPGFDISAFRTETVTGDEVKAELADALGIDRSALVYSLPGHYRANSSGIEVIEIARHMGFSLGNVAKFIGRAGEEAGFVADLEKALFYIDDAIDNDDGVPWADWPAIADIDAYLTGQSSVGVYGPDTEVYRLVMSTQRRCIEAVGLRCEDPMDSARRRDMLESARADLASAIGLIHDETESVRFVVHIDPSLLDGQSGVLDEFVAGLDSRSDVEVLTLPEMDVRTHAMLIASTAGASSATHVWVCPQVPAEVVKSVILPGESSLIPVPVGEVFDAGDRLVLKGLLR